jgi:hypothetical protein
MTSSTTHTRRLVVLAAAGLAALAIAPTAQAGDMAPDRADGLGGANATVHTPQVLPPDRVDQVGVTREHPYTIAVSPPDRVDGLGSDRLPTTAAPIVAPAPTVIIRSTGSGFDWTAAVIGAVGGIGFAAIALAAALLFRSRRDVVLPS